MLRNEDKRRSHPWVLGLLEACWGLRFRPICAPKRINSSAFKSHLIQADHSARLEQFAAFDLPTIVTECYGGGGPGGTDKRGETKMTVLVGESGAMSIMDAINAAGFVIVSNDALKAGSDGYG